MGKPPPADYIDSVRAFNRFYTNVIGVLSETLLDSPYTLTEVRVLFELARRDGADASELRRSIGIDAGYLSRILARFEGEGLLARERSEADRRRTLLQLTDTGRDAFGPLDRRSSEQVAGLLSGLDPSGQRQVVGAMRLIESHLNADHSPREVVLRAPQPGDLGWVVQSQGAGYSRQFGWNAEYETLISRIVADYAEDHDPEREACWIAEIDGAQVGSVFCVKSDEETAKLRLLWVDPVARGLGVGRTLVQRCVDFATAAGYSTMKLWTVSLLDSARRIYQGAGFTLSGEEPVHMFGHDLTAQTWTLKLR